MANAYTVNKDMRERTTIEMIIKSHDKLKEKVENHLLKQNKKIQAQQLETALNNLFADVKKFQNNPDTFEDKIAGQFYSEWLSEVNNTLTSSGNVNITKLLSNFNLTNLKGGQYDNIFELEIDKLLTTALNSPTGQTFSRGSLLTNVSTITNFDNEILNDINSIADSYIKAVKEEYNKKFSKTSISKWTMESGHGISGKADIILPGASLRLSVSAQKPKYIDELVTLLKKYKGRISFSLKQTKGRSISMGGAKMYRSITGPLSLPGVGNDTYARNMYYRIPIAAHERAKVLEHAGAIRKMYEIGGLGQQNSYNNIDFIIINQPNGVKVISASDLILSSIEDHQTNFLNVSNIRIKI